MKPHVFKVRSRDSGYPIDAPPIMERAYKDEVGYLKGHGSGDHTVSIEWGEECDGWNCGVVTDEQVSEVLAEVVFYWEEYLSLKGKDE